MDPLGSDTGGIESSLGDPAGIALVPLQPGAGKAGEAPTPNIRHLAGDSPGWGAGMDKGHGQGSAGIKLLTGHKQEEPALQDYEAIQTPLRKFTQNLP